jgi:hypothetical protein
VVVTGNDLIKGEVEFQRGVPAIAETFKTTHNSIINTHARPQYSHPLNILLSIVCNPIHS